MDTHDEANSHFSYFVTTPKKFCMDPSMFLCSIMSLTINSDYFFTQHQPICLQNGDAL